MTAPPRSARCRRPVPRQPSCRRLRRRQCFVWLVVLPALTLATASCGYIVRPRGVDRGVTRADLPRLERHDGDRVHSFLRPDAIPSIDAPVFVPAAEATSFMTADEWVLGVVHDGVARAYSLWHLDRHEIVNDRLAQLPIAATW